MSGDKLSDLKYDVVSAPSICELTRLMNEGIDSGSIVDVVGGVNVEIDGPYSRVFRQAILRVPTRKTKSTKRKS